jgi:hypothetical protein
MYSHAQLNDAFGFQVPKSYVRMLEIAEQLNPADSNNAFDPLALYQLDRFGFHAKHAESPPELVIFGWTGNDDGHYAFIVDDPRRPCEEYQIGLFYGDGTVRRIVASSIPEFLGVLCRSTLEDEPEGDEAEN